jgi:hypothetical protein
MLDSPLQKGSNKPEPKDLTLSAAFFVASSPPLCWRNPGFLLAKLFVVAGEIPICDVQITLPMVRPQYFLAT